MVISFTVDVEPDAPPYLNTWRGVEEGLPKLINVLEKCEIPATFFVTGKTCERYSRAIREIPRKFEIGCHGYEHERFDRLSESEQKRRIGLATKVLRRVVKRKILGFRAPNFRAGPKIGRLLKKFGYLYDSSWAVYHLRNPPPPREVVEIPNTVFSSVLRLPPWLTVRLVSALAHRMPVVVLDYHVWEIVEMKNVRFDCRFATGSKALQRLEHVLGELKKKFEFADLQTIARALRCE